MHMPDVWDLLDTSTFMFRCLRLLFLRDWIDVYTATYRRLGVSSRSRTLMLIHILPRNFQRCSFKLGYCCHAIWLSRTRAQITWWIQFDHLGYWLLFLSDWIGVYNALYRRLRVSSRSTTPMLIHILPRKFQRWNFILGCCCHGIWMGRTRAQVTWYIWFFQLGSRQHFNSFFRRNKLHSGSSNMQLLFKRTCFPWILRNPARTHRSQKVTVGYPGFFWV